VNPDDAAAQEDAIKNAEVIFKYVAETYLEMPASSATSTAPRPQPVMKTASFLASACSFQRPITAATATPISKRTPQDELDDELNRYFNYEAAPIERQEGEEGGNDGEPLAQEVLLNPLLWWKVSTFFMCLYPSDTSYSETRL
jgi:hypothetical protein